MRLVRWATTFKNAIARGVFPHQMSFFLELPWRNILLSPMKLADRLHLSTVSRVLEVGSGSGFYSAEVAGRTSKGRLELFDLQPEMLKKARRKLESKGQCNVSYTIGDAGRLPFEQQCFDVVFLVTVWGK